MCGYRLRTKRRNRSVAHSMLFAGCVQYCNQTKARVTICAHEYRMRNDMCTSGVCSRRCYGFTARLTAASEHTSGNAVAIQHAVAHVHVHYVQVVPCTKSTTLPCFTDYLQPLPLQYIIGSVAVNTREKKRLLFS